MDKRIYSHSCKLNPPCLPEPFKRWVKALKDEWEREVYDVLKDDANQSRRGGLERGGGQGIRDGVSGGRDRKIYFIPATLEKKKKSRPSNV